MRGRMEGQMESMHCMQTLTAKRMHSHELQTPSNDAIIACTFATHLSELPVVLILLDCGTRLV